MRRANWPLLLILLAAACLRLVSIDTALVGEHAQRQADTAAIARSFHVESHGLFRPQVDWRGDGPGWIESEFPLMPWLVSLAYGLFGVHEWFGRLFSLLCSVAMIFFAHNLIRRTIDERMALFSAFFLAILPSSVFFGRVFMPEPLMLLSAVIGIDSFARFSDGGKRRDLIISALFMSLACSVKLPALHLGAPILYLAWSKEGGALFRRPWFYLYGAAVLIPVTAWYAHAAQLHTESGLTFGIWLPGEDKWANWELVSSAAFWKRILLYYLAKFHLTFAGMSLFLVGLGLRRQQPRERLFDVWLVGSFVYLLIVGRGNYDHNYYQLPLVVPAVVMMARPCVRFGAWPWRFRESRRPLAAACVALAILGVVVMSVDRSAKLFEREWKEEPLTLATAARVRSLTSPDDLVIVAEMGNTELLYYADRKGWVEGLDSLSPSKVSAHRSAGATLIVSNRRRWSDAHERNLETLRENYEVLVDQPNEFVLRLSDPE
jgi:hypothetical protein